MITVIQFDESVTVRGLNTEIRKEIRWPSFLDLLDSDPKRSGEEFYSFVIGQFTLAPPKAMQSESSEKRQDYAHDVVVHCIKDNFKVLRRYKDNNLPFAVWLYFVANNLIRTIQRKENKEPLPVDGQVLDKVAEKLGNPGANSQERQAEVKELYAAVSSCLDKIDAYCRTLLKMSAEEWHPREMVRVLGWPREKAKKVSNDLGYCRTKLENMLVDYGQDIEMLKKESRKKKE